MFKHILVSTDLSDRATNTIDIIKESLRTESTRVSLLHVIEEIAETDPEEFREFYTGLEERTAAKLAYLAARLETPGIELTRESMSSPLVTMLRCRAMSLVVRDFGSGRDGA